MSAYYEDEKMSDGVDELRVWLLGFNDYVIREFLDVCPDFGSKSELKCRRKGDVRQARDAAMESLIWHLKCLDKSRLAVYEKRDREIDWCRVAELRGRVSALRDVVSWLEGVDEKFQTY